MTRRNWKREVPRSLSHAVELCIAHARDKKNLSVDNIADLMELANKWMLYKWTESGRMPAILIRPFEHACDCSFMTQYFATSNNKMLVDIPKGRKFEDSELLELQSEFNDAVNLLARFYQCGAEAEETIGALTKVMEGIAGHRANVSKVMTPELGL